MGANNIIELFYTIRLSRSKGGQTIFRQDFTPSSQEFIICRTGQIPDAPTRLCMYPPDYPTASPGHFGARPVLPNHEPTKTNQTTKQSPVLPKREPTNPKHPAKLIYIKREPTNPKTQPSTYPASQVTNHASCQQVSDTTSNLYCISESASN